MAVVETLFLIGFVFGGTSLSILAARDIVEDVTGWMAHRGRAHARVLAVRNVDTKMMTLRSLQHSK